MLAYIQLNLLSTIELVYKTTSNATFEVMLMLNFEMKIVLKQTFSDKLLDVGKISVFNRDQQSCAVLHFTNLQIPLSQIRTVPEFLFKNFCSRIVV